MLKKIRLTDFKSFVDEEISLAPVTLLVGANASGKSNLIEALRFLRGTTTDASFAELINGDEREGPEAWPGLRGRAAEAARVGTSAFTLQTTWLAPDSDDPWGVATPEAIRNALELTHRLTVRTLPHPALEAESLGRGEAVGNLFTTGEVKGDGIEVAWEKRTVPWKRSSRWKRSSSASEGGARSPSMRLGRDLSLLWAILGSADPGSPIVPEEVAHYASALSGALSHIEYLSIQPPHMRGYGRRERSLGAEGRNISGVLAGLCDDPRTKRSLVDWLAELCAPELEDIDFIEIKELGDVMAVLIEKGGKRISFRSLSDGTLWFIGTLVALRTAEPGSLILMEEIENGLHPTRIRLLVEYVQAVARERQLQIIASTHSPVVLQWLSDAALRDAVVFGRVPDREGTMMCRLGELPHFEEAIQRKGIDELFTTGWLEMAL